MSYDAAELPPALGRAVLSDRLAAVPLPFRNALAWFHARRGQEIRWPSPSPVSGVLHLVTAAKGIYKPEGSNVALSVRQTLHGPYANRSVVTRADGSWTYAYHQEGTGREPTGDFTNEALLRNLATATPVAVLVQTSSVPSMYRVLGLAMVAGWSGGYFYLEGFGDDGTAGVTMELAQDAIVEAEAEVAASFEHEMHLDSELDARIKARADVIRRRGQGRFRRNLIAAYGGRCAISGCEVAEALDAAHILPYRGDHSDATTNGLLLRTDLHALFDCGVLAVDPDTRSVVLARRLRSGYYGCLHGVRVAEPLSPKDRPSRAILAEHLSWCGVRL